MNTNAQSDRPTHRRAIVVAAAAMAVALGAGLLQAFQATAALPACTSACTAYNPGVISSLPPSTIIQQVPTPVVIDPLPCIGPIAVQDPVLINGPGPVEYAQMADAVCVGPPDPTPPLTCVAPQVLSNGTCVDPAPPTCVAPQVLSNGTCVDPPPLTCVAPQVLTNGACVTPPPPPPVKPAPVADTGSDNGGTDVQTQPDTTATPTADVVVPLIKPTAPKKPPVLPHHAPHNYGTVRLVATGRIHNGLKASFSFVARPTAGAQLQTTWYYNNKPIGKALKTMRTTITTSVQSTSPLPAGYWRCTLRVKLPNGPWRELQDARQLLH